MFEKPVRNIGKYVYHSTKWDNFLNISKDMMLYPSSKPNWGGSLGEESLGKLYFSRTKDSSQFYGNILGETYTIKVPAKNLKNAFYDCWTYSSITGESLNYISKDDIYTTKPVSLKGAYVWNGEEWRKLNKDMAEAIGYGEWNDMLI